MIFEIIRGLTDTGRRIRHFFTAFFCKYYDGGVCKLLEGQGFYGAYYDFCCYENCEKMEKAIKECRWRKEVGGIGVCRAVNLPCTRAFEKGVCDTLIKLAKEGEEDGSID